MRNWLHFPIVGAVLAVTVSSFSIHQPPSSQFARRVNSPSHSLNRLSATQVDSDHDSSSPLPNWTELPLKREAEVDLAPVEIGLGRIAMLGFFGLLAVEVITGESFSEQIIDFVRLFS